MKFPSLPIIALVWALVPSPGAGQTRLDPGALELASAQAAVADLASGELLFTKHADRQVPIASVTKLMSAVVVLDSGAPLDEQGRAAVLRSRPATMSASDSVITSGSPIRLAYPSSGATP